MSDFKAKIHQIPFLGELIASPRPVAVFKGPTSKGREGKRNGAKGGGEGKGKRREGERRAREEGRGGREREARKCEA